MFDRHLSQCCGQTTAVNRGISRRVRYLRLLSERNRERRREKQQPASCLPPMGELHLNRPKVRDESTKWQPVTGLRDRFGDVERQIGVFLKYTLVIGKKSHRVIRLEEIR